MARYCDGIDRSQILRHFDYMRMAAESGDVYAQVKLLSAMTDLSSEAVDEAHALVWDSDEQLRADHMHFAHEAAARGVVEAIFLAGMDPNLAATDAAGYRLAGAHLYIQSGAEPKELFEGYIHKMSMELNPSELELATAKAREIIASDVCCSVFEVNN